jgi:hypothetical protein
MGQTILKLRPLLLLLLLAAAFYYVGYRYGHSKKELFTFSEIKDKYVLGDVYLSSGSTLLLDNYILGDIHAPASAMIVSKFNVVTQCSEASIDTERARDKQILYDESLNEPKGTK